LIETSPAASNEDHAKIIASLLDDIFANHIIIGDIHAPMDELSDVFKITKDDSIIGGWTIFKGFDIPTVVFPPNLPESWDLIKDMVDVLNYPEIFATFPKSTRSDPNPEFPWDNWTSYAWEHMFTDKAMRFEGDSLEVMDISHLPTIRGAGEADLPKLNEFFDKLKKSSDYTGFWVPQQLKTDLYVVAEDDQGEIIAVAGTHFETPMTVQIGNVHVLSEHRQKGLGTALSTAVCLGIVRFHRTPTLFVNENNITAQKMYEKIGFKEYNEYIFYKGIKSS
jgi:ribosomal protein S18 acetylase RimI-like enzyme